jgi:GPH family glycoside/pentoside/hexuronide:cation symporter
LSPNGKFIWALSTYITFTTLYTVLSVPYGSLIPAMTQDTDERTSLSSYRYIAASCGAIVVASLTLPLVSIFADQKNGFVFAVSCFAIIALIFLILCFYNTKEPFAKYDNNRYDLKKIFKMLIENKPFQLILIAISTTWVANNMKTATVVYFVKYNLNLEQFFGPIVLGAILQIILGAWIANIVKNKLEKKDIFIIGTLLYVISDLIIFYLIGYNNFWILAFFASFGFIGFGMAGVMVWSMLSDTVEYGEWKSDIRAEGILNSFFNFFFKFGVGLSGWLAGQILEKNNYIPQEINQDNGVLLGLFQMGYLYPAISGTIAIIFLANFKYNKEFYTNIIKEINLK